jgi:GDP-4-dehydro-6-deoxy-D-mannose reductase
MKNVLITGITGMIGSHLADYLVEKKGLTVYGFVRPESIDKNIAHLKGRIKLIIGRMEDEKLVIGALKKSSPDIIFHLAAQSSPFRSWEDPVGTFNINVNGTIYLLEAIKNLKINPVTYIACSSAAYGFVNPHEIPIKESRPLRPLSPYGVSKATQEMLGIQYFENYNQKNIMGRFFNQIGPRQDSSYAVQSFCRQIVEIEKGLKKSLIRVGNLSTRRDFLDVRDGVNAIWLLTQKGKVGEVYHICSGRSPAISEVLEVILSKARTKVEVSVDKGLLRPSDEPILQGDNSKIKKDTGWAPKYSLSETIDVMLDYWRKRL